MRFNEHDRILDSFDLKNGGYNSAHKGNKKSSFDTNPRLNRSHGKQHVEPKEQSIEELKKTYEMLLSKVEDQEKTLVPSPLANSLPNNTRSGSTSSEFTSLMS